MESRLEFDSEVLERARLSRDARFDGRFFVGVRTTGIYCRPICPANLPRSENVSFFASAAAASEAGFRPCLRCRPECAPGTPAWSGTSVTVQRGLRLIAAGALDEGNIEQLAERLGVTSRHLRRLFARHVGASPLAVAHTQRLHFAKRLIDQTALPMKDICVAAGFGSIRRFNDAIRRTYGRPPRQLRRGGQGATASGRTLSLLMTYRQPYGWDRLLDFFAARAIPGVERVLEGRYERAVEVGGSRGLIVVSDIGGALSLSVSGVATESLFGVVQRARSLFDVDAPIDDITRVLGRDEQLRVWLATNPGVRVPGAWDGWELAVRAILGQQVSVRAATTLAARLTEKYGRRIVAEGDGQTPDRLFPGPDRLARARLETAGIIRSRAQSIRELARAVISGDVCFDAGQAAEEFRQRLINIRGIGEWTADYIAMRALKNPDAFPGADLGLLRAFDPVSGTRLRRTELAARAEKWRPWRAYAALLAWNSDSQRGG
jgi:AraC family transcriptional regulator of adaptative response / DNA-3-methyladenine glycosylase II